MVKIRQRIEIVSSTTPGLSSMSVRSREATREALSKYYDDVRITIINTLSDLDELVLRRPDLVFSGMSFVFDETTQQKVWVSGHLDAHGITCTGSGQPAHDLERNKHLAKQVVINSGLRTSPFVVITRGASQLADTSQLTYPLFVKPTNSGGGTGIDEKSIVHNSQELRSKAESIERNHRTDALAEQYLPGREFSVAVLRRENSDKYSVMPIELVAPIDKDGNRVLGQATKRSNEEQIVELVDPVLRAAVCEHALAVFHALGARDYGRIDIRLDANGIPNFLEANLIPSLIAGYGSFPKACLLNINLDYEPMLLRIIDLALERKQATANQHISPNSFLEIVPSLSGTPGPV